MQLRDLLADMPLRHWAVVPLALQQLLRQELDVRNDWQTAETLLLRARQVLPHELALGVALYKLYAYSNRFDEALTVINEVLSQAAETIGIAADWRQLADDCTPWLQAAGDRRCYLYSLKATGFVRLRRGDSDEAYAVLRKLQRLDPMDQVGGSVVLEMAERIIEDDQGDSP